MDNFYQKIEKYNPDKKNKLQIVFDDMIAHMLCNIKLNPKIMELFVKSNIFLVFITQPYLAVPKKIKLNYTHYFIMAIPNKQDFQQISFNYSADINCQNFRNQKLHCKTIFFFSYSCYSCIR